MKKKMIGYIENWFDLRFKYLVGKNALKLCTSTISERTPDNTLRAYMPEVPKSGTFCGRPDGRSGTFAHNLAAECPNPGFSYI